MYERKIILLPPLFSIEHIHSRDREEKRRDLSSLLQEPPISIYSTKTKREKGRREAPVLVACYNYKSYNISISIAIIMLVLVLLLKLPKKKRIGNTISSLPSIVYPP